MFEWLLLKENALSAAENTIWKESALRIILVSGLFLEFVIGTLSAVDAMRVGAYYIVAVVVGFCVALLFAAHASIRRPLVGSAMLIVTIYAAAFCIVYFTREQEVRKLGILFIYTTPLIAGIFFGTRLALVLMVANILPFVMLVMNRPLPAYPHLSVLTVDGHAYIQSLLFLFFNICVPLAVFRLLHALDAAIQRQRAATAELESSHAQYQEIFENAGGAILLCDKLGRILKSNAMADALIGRPDCHKGQLANLFSLIVHKCRDAHEQAVADVAALQTGQEFQTRDERLLAIESIASTSGMHYMLTLRDISHIRQIQEALEHSKARESFLSNHDQLTRLPNRNLLRQQLEQAMAVMGPRRRIALVLIRLDSIKYINDSRGTVAGDALILAFANALRQLLPPDSLHARLRSVLFCFTIESHYGSNDVIPQVEYIRSCLPTELQIGNEVHQLQLSMAVAFSLPDETDGDQLIQRGKLAMDVARHSGNRNVAIFDDQAGAQVRRRLSIEQALVTALRENEMRVVYQPKVTHEGHIVGLEALVRWRSPTLGELSPSEFIPVAENCGAMHLITAFVLEQVCVYVRKTLDLDGSCLPIAINLSANDIVREDLLDMVNAICQQYRVSPEQLEFEITETGLVGDENLAITHLEALTAQGYAITIDDFGTGYSSLQKLSRFPTKSIKIDRSFVAQIGISEKSEVIIRAVVSLAKILSCTTVAEGVETLAQETFLKAIGCQFFQGFYYYRPMECEQLSEVLKGR